MTSTPSVSALSSFEPGFVARDDEVGLLRDARRDASTGRLRPLGRLLTRHRGHRAPREHDRLPVERPSGVGGDRSSAIRTPAARRRSINADVLRIVEPLADARGDLGPDPRHGVDLVDGRAQPARRSNRMPSASTCATCEPTWRMLSPTSSRQSGRSFDASICDRTFVIDFVREPRRAVPAARRPAS